MVFIKEIKYLAARAAHWNSLNYLFVVETQYEKVLIPLSSHLCCKVRVEMPWQEVGTKIHHYSWLLGWFLTQADKWPCGKLPYFPFISLQIWASLTSVCILVLHNIYKCKRNCSSIANFTFCVKESKKKHFSFSLFSLGSPGFDAKLFPLHKPGLTCLTCCSERFPRLVPALPWGTWWSQKSGILIHRF